MGDLLFLDEHRADPRVRARPNRLPLVTSLPSAAGGDVYQGYREHMLRRRRSPETIRLRLFYLRKFEAWIGGDLTAVKHDDLEGYIWSNPDWSPSTRQVITMTLRTFYRWANREGHLGEDPSRDLPPIRVHRRKQRIASDEAIRRAVQCDDISDRAMVLLAAECGLRVSEIATLHIDARDDDWLHIIGKGNQARWVHMEAELIDILDQLEATRMRHGFYFPGRTGARPIHTSTARTHIAAIVGSNPHSLRRRAGTVVYHRSGKDIRIAQEFLGHKTSATTEHYLEVGRDAMVVASRYTRIGAA